MLILFIILPRCLATQGSKISKKIQVKFVVSSLLSNCLESVLQVGDFLPILPGSLKRNIQNLFIIIISQIISDTYLLKFTIWFYSGVLYFPHVKQSCALKSPLAILGNNGSQPQSPYSLNLSGPLSHQVPQNQTLNHSINKCEAKIKRNDVHLNASTFTFKIINKNVKKKLWAINQQAKVI